MCMKERVRKLPYSTVFEVPTREIQLVCDGMRMLFCVEQITEYIDIVSLNITINFFRICQQKIRTGRCA